MALQLHLTGRSPANQEHSGQMSAVPQQQRRRLLIVDDEPMLLKVLENIFRDMYDLRTAESGEMALQILQQGFLPEVIIADQRMPGMSGAQFLAQSIRELPTAVRVVLTGYTDVQDIIDSINLGNIYRFLTKPWQREELIETVRVCFEYYDMLTRNAELTDALEKLEIAHNELQILNSEKDEFLGIAAHDLKNPLGNIRGLAELLLEHRSELDDADLNKILLSIINSSERMFSLIANLLDINAIERGGITLQLIRIAAKAPLTQIAEQYRQRAAAKSLRIVVESYENHTVCADEQAFVQIMDNLVSNAVKYSPADKVIYIRSSQHQNICRIEVQDEGPGISAQDMEKLFGKFMRLSAQPTGGEHSTGLGLSIVKKLVELMNGIIWCESTPGNGATFIVELPSWELKRE